MQSRTSTTIVLTTVLGLCLTLTASGQGSRPQTDEKQPGPSATNDDRASNSDSPEGTKKNETGRKDGDRKLLKDLIGDLSPRDSEASDGESDTSAPDELDQAVASMRKVSDRIGDGDTSKDLQDVQRSILKNIDKLIEQLKNQPPPSPQENPQPSQNPKPNQQSPGDGSPSPNQQRKESPQGSGSPKPQAGTSGSQQNQKPSGESSERNQGEAKKRESELSRRRALINEIWGHLRPADREKLLNVGGEKLLPQYKELINRYYEALAEAQGARSKR